ncbi:uncharacterized protein [Bemisia tabaci]|uniref:uncharacterized protein n=1 Tax=Bemisia tabaci TaxID=7038 RepID=UPI003B282BBD
MAAQEQNVETFIQCDICDEFYKQGEKHEHGAEQIKKEEEGINDETYIKQELIQCDICDEFYRQGEKHEHGAEQIKKEEGINDETHIKQEHNALIHCDLCDEFYAEGENHEQSPEHIEKMSTSSPTDDNNDQEYCDTCKISYHKREKHEESASHIRNLFEMKVPIVQVETACQSRLKTFFITNFQPENLIIDEYLLSAKDLMLKKIKEELTGEALKVNILVYAEYEKADDKDKEGMQLKKFKTKNEAIFASTDLDEYYEKFRAKINKESFDFHMNGSGWVLKKIQGMELRINRYYALHRGGTYVKLPFRTNNVVNVNNGESNDCFRYAMLGKFVPKEEKNKFRPEIYVDLFDRYDFSDVRLPTSIDDIIKFEKRNNVSVSVFGLRESLVSNKKKYTVYPIKVADPEREDHTDLLCLSTPVPLSYHYCWISNFEQLVRNQLTKYHHRIYICKKCFTYKYSMEELSQHKVLCSLVSKDAFLASFPDERYLKFENHHKEIKHNYVIYADFEAYLEQIHGDSEHPASAYRRHISNSYAYLLVTEDPEFKMTEPKLYRGEEAHIKFLDDIITLVGRISESYNDKESKIIMTHEDRATFEAENRCGHCEVDFSQPGIVKVRDHDHQKRAGGKTRSNYRKALCSNCNLIFRHEKCVRVVLHNGSRYDFHEVVLALNKYPHRVEIIPHTEENYISMTVHLGNRFSIKFIDSFRFLPASLDKLVQTIPRESFVRTRKLTRTDNEFDMVCRKAPFPYDYVDNPAKLNETRPPPREAFFNTLTQTDISEEEYERFLQVWQTFNFRNLGEYSDFYLRLDVCLLSDVFEEFRLFGIKNYSLDCANYLTLPGFAFDAFLKITNVKIQLFNDMDMVFMIMSSIRGGITQVVKRHALANNPLIPDQFDPKKPVNYIQYLDVTALYAHTMRKHLPYDNYTWVPEGEELLTLAKTIINHPDDAPFGYILDVDIEYPEHLHDLHKDLPFLCKNEIPPSGAGKCTKLLTTLANKNNYVIHYVMLKEALGQGLKLLRVNRAIKFRQAPFLAPFIELNARLRREATNPFHQTLLKLCSNACYGKFIENPLKRKNIKLGTNSRQILKAISRVDFIDRTIFAEELVAIHLRRTEVVIDRPMIVGFSILDLSKVHMYQFHYNHMLKKYNPDQVQLLYMDTDSFIYELTTPNVYDDMMSDLHLYDTSNFPEGHQCRSATNRKVMGSFKDETGGIPIAEFVALRPKMYAYRFSDGETEKRAKGISTPVVRSLNFANFLTVLKDPESRMTASMRRIGARKHQLYSFETTKRTLSGLDDKRCILEDGVSTVPWGHRENKDPCMVDESCGAETELRKILAVKQLRINSIDNSGEPSVKKPRI